MPSLVSAFVNAARNPSPMDNADRKLIGRFLSEMSRGISTWLRVDLSGLDFSRITEASHDFFGAAGWELDTRRSELTFTAVDQDVTVPHHFEWEFGVLVANTQRLVSVILAEVGPLALDGTFRRFVDLDHSLTQAEFTILRLAHPDLLVDEVERPSGFGGRVVFSHRD